MDKLTTTEYTIGLLMLSAGFFAWGYMLLKTLANFGGIQ